MTDADTEAGRGEGRDWADEWMDEHDLDPLDVIDKYAHVLSNLIIDPPDSGAAMPRSDAIRKIEAALSRLRQSDPGGNKQ